MSLQPRAEVQGRRRVGVYPRWGPLLGGLTALAALAPAAAAAEWTMFRGDPALTGVAAEELPATLAPLWSFEVGEGIESTAAIAGGAVYVGALDGHLYALDLGSGELRWKYAARDEVKSSPAVREGTVFFGDEAGVFHAVDARTGTARWTYATEGGITSSANFGNAGGATRVLFGSYDGYLYALAPEDGSLAWKLETQSYVHATPAIAGGAALFGGCDGLFRVVDVASGKELAALPVAAYVAASAAVRDGRAFVGTFENEVLGIDLAAAGGEGEEPRVAWRYRPERDFPFYASPAVAGDRVIFGGRDKVVHALDPASGELRWSFTTPARVDASPVVSGDRVFVASLSGDLYALDLASGAVVWQYATGAPIVASPAVGGGRLLVGTADGVLFAFGAAAGTGGAG